MEYQFEPMEKCFRPRRSLRAPDGIILGVR